MKKNVLLTVILSVSALIVGIAGTLAVMVFGIYGPKLTKAENEIESLSTSLSDTQGQLSTLQEQHNTLKSENTTLKNDHETLKANHTKLQADYNKIAGDVAAKKAEVEKLQKEAAQAEKDLAKAKKGVQSLTKVSKLFDSYDKQCDELAKILVDYADALEANNMSLAATKAQEYAEKAEIADNTYEEITDLLEAFRKENNL